MSSSESTNNNNNNINKKPTAFIVNFEDAQITSSSANTTTNSNASNTTQESNNSSSLQDAFKKYRDEKIRARNIYESNKAKRKSFRTNPERMWKLRLKFVEQAKKFLGVPYAKKYFSPGTPEYCSKLFLDCCGLVRRVMRDLEDDFGFRIGSGNQNYMWDTLPIEIKRLEDVKPGDLVFTSGIYFNPKMKKQAHGITHVEIMLGEGEKTIGARWNNGKVSFFDSYKFESKSFHSAQYYFRSLDPWLWGYCRSFCDKHGWRYNTARPSKKSIFYSRSQRQERKSKSEISFKSSDSRLRTSPTKSSSAKLKKSKRKIKKVKTARPKLSKENTSLTIHSTSLHPHHHHHHHLYHHHTHSAMHTSHSCISNRNGYIHHYNRHITRPITSVKSAITPRVVEKVVNLRVKSKEEQEQVEEEEQYTDPAEEEQEAAAEEEVDDDNNDVQIDSKLLISESNPNEVFDCNNAIDVENVLKILSEIEKQEEDGDEDDESESDCDSKYVNGNSGSENENFSSDEYDRLSQYTSSDSSRKQDTRSYYNQMYDDDYPDENDDNNDIRISAIQNNLRILSID